MKSNKPIKEPTRVFAKRMFVFPMEYAQDNIGGKKGMLISINSKNVFIECGKPVDLDYDTWSLLKNIGRIGRVVTAEPEINEKQIL